MKSNTNKKIISLSELSKLRKNNKNKKIVHCHGVFDLFHHGHLMYFNSARKLGDILVVSITNDKNVNKGPGRPRFGERRRAEIIASLSVVDYVVINDEKTAVNLINLLKPNFYVKGKDYEKKDLDRTGGIILEETALKKNKGKIIFTKDELNSSTKLINLYFSQLDDIQKNIINNIKKEYKLKDILKIIDDIKKIKIFLIGEPIIDRYIFCKPLNLSSKSPSISSRYLKKEDYTGGSLAIAKQAAELGCKVNVSFIAGKEKPSKKIFDNLKKEKNIKLDILFSSKHVTPIKTRFLEPFANQRMFEIIDVGHNDNKKEKNIKLIEKIKKNIDQSDIIIIADYGHGLLNDIIIKEINKKRKFTAVNVQSNSENLGFNLFHKYSKYNYLSIDEKECRLGMHDRFSDIDSLSRKMHRKVNKNMAITLDKNGSIYFRKNKAYRCPAFFTKTVDTVGAGDTFFLITSLLDKLNCPPDLIPFIGNIYAGLATQIIGNSRPVRRIDLVRSIESLMG